VPLRAEGFDIGGTDLSDEPARQDEGTVIYVAS
jgi:hypothetical protein